jgi:Zn-dependent protease with chaperone function
VQGGLPGSNEERPVHAFDSAHAVPPRPEIDLVGAVRLDFERIRLAPLYRVGLFFAAVTMLLIPLVYVGLIGLVGYGVWYHATRNYGIIGASTSVHIIVATYVGPIIAGVLGILFMVKPLFAPRLEPPRPRTLSRDEQPMLYAYVDALCTSLGAPKPCRIDVDMQVNASASFRRGFLSLLGSDLVLTLGMPLTAGMTLAQWTGVLAHEFGHFTQGAAMRFTYLIGAVNHWFARVVHERDAWDERLDRWERESKWGMAQIVLLISRVFIWISRRILWVLMMIGLAVSSFLSRQMEFNADLHQARISGSDLFRQTHLRLPVLSIAWERATSYLSHMWSEGRLVDDVVGLVLAEAARIDESEDIRAHIRDGVAQEKTHWFDTHPSTPDRIAAVEQLRLAARVDIDAPATAVFRGCDALCRQLSLEFYERVLGEPVSPSSLVDTRTALAKQEAGLESHRALGEYFLGTELATVGVFPSGSLAPDPEPHGAAARIEILRDRMRSGATEVHAAIADLDRIGHRRRVAGLLVRAAEAKLKLGADGSGLSNEDIADPTAAVAASEEERDATLERLAPRIEEATQRIDAAIALAVRPDVTHYVGQNADVVERLPRLVPALAAIQPQWRRLRAIQIASMELDYLLSQAGPTIEPGPLQDEVVALWRSLLHMGRAFREELSDVEYPYDHAHGSKSLADFLIESVPELGPDVGPVVAGAGHRLGQLYFRIWSDLVSLAIEIERQLSLPPAEPIPAAGAVPGSAPAEA